MSALPRAVRRAALALACALAAGCASALGAERAPPPRQIEFALLEDYDKGASLDTVASDFRVMKELGIRTWRGSFGWDDYEPRPGVYDLEWLDRFVALAEKEGIRLRPYLGYTPAWAGGGGHDREAWNDPPRSMAQWQAFVRRIASEYARSPALASWEIYNEENAPQWFDGTVQQYADVLASASAAIRAVAPRAQVVLGGLTYPDVDWLRAICRRPGLRDAFDVAALHVYAETWPRDKRVEDFLAGSDYRVDFLGTLHRECHGQPVWINETGFATAPGRTEADQAAWWARAIATYAADTTVHFVGIYETREPPRTTGVIGEPENYYLGIRYPNGKHKLAFATVKLMVSLLGGRFRVLDPVLPPASHSGAVIHLFGLEDGRRVLLAWTRGTTPTSVRVPLGRPVRRLVRYSLDGSARTVAATGREVVVDVRPGDVAIYSAE